MYHMTMTLDAASKTPMYEQLYRCFAADIRAGVLAAGERLPSKRALSAHLGVSLVTVETAYTLLLSEGYIRSKPRSGYFVSDFVTLTAPERGGSVAVRAPAPQRSAAARNCSRRFSGVTRPPAASAAALIVEPIKPESTM